MAASEATTPGGAASHDAAVVREGSVISEAAVIEEIRRLAAGLGPTGALVIFPEGGNFTPSRWRRGVRRLVDAHRYSEAARASRMRNLLPPRSGGAFAAIDAAPTADVIFVAHTGLDDLITVGRCVAGAADGAGHPGPVVARASGRRTPRTGGRHALALRLVGTHRRLDRREPPHPPSRVTSAAAATATATATAATAAPALP